MIPAVLAGILASDKGVGVAVDEDNPLVYAGDLRFWYTAGAGVTNAGTVNLDWVGQIQAPDRSIIALVAFETNAGATLSGVTFGGVAMTQLGTISVTASPFTNTVAVFGIQDSQATAANGHDIVASFTGTAPSGVAIAVALYSETLTSPAITNTVVTDTSTATDVEPTIASLATASQGFAVAVAIANNPLGTTNWVGYNKQFDVPVTGGTQSHISVADIPTDGTAIAGASVDFTGGTFTRSAVLAISLNDSAGANPMRRLTEWQIIGNGDPFFFPTNAVLEPDSGDAQFPALAATQINGLPALQFGVGSADALDQRAESSNDLFDNIWTRTPGVKNIGFAAQIDSISHKSTGALNLVVKNEASGNAGWRLAVNASGRLLFILTDDEGDTWGVVFFTSYDDGDLVAGSVSWDGIRKSTNPNITARVLINGEFVDLVGNPFGDPNGSFDDAGDSLVIGNRSAAANFNQAWSGYIADIWFTSPARTSVNDAYLGRYVPS